MNTEYLSLFIEESREHLQALNENVLVLENDKTNLSTIQVIFRSAHTLKGMAGTMGYDDMVSLTHQMENVLDQVRNDQLGVDDHILEILFKCIDALEAMLEDIVNGGQGKKDVTDIVSSLKAILDGEANVGLQVENDTKTSPTTLDEFQLQAIVGELEREQNVFFVQVSLSENCLMKSARAYMVFDILEQNGNIIQTTPSVNEIENGQFDTSFTFYYSTAINSKYLHDAIMSISEVQSIDVLVIDDEYTNNIKSKTENLGNAVDTSEKETKKVVQVVQNRTIRVDIDRLDSLMNLFSELLIDRVRLEQLSNEIHRKDLTETVQHMNRVSSNLQDIVLKLRMVQIDTVFNRFPRMIRDVAKSLNKKVDLVITGADTELDRTVVEDIGDPLVHLLRNAVDHGLESSEDRIKIGKSATGTINLRAFHSGNHIFIEIEDDGPGINTEKVLSIAIKKGIVNSEQAEKLSTSDIHQLLFASGFSTADKISDISGRGVGLDVVKTKIESLGGHVVIESQPGLGTKFSVQLPLTLSIITALLVKLGDEKFAVPLTSIVETAIINKSQIHYMNGVQHYMFRDIVIPLISLSDMFGIESFSELNEENTEIVIIKKGSNMAAIMIDEFVGQQDIVLKTMGSYLTNLFAISGATILGDGQVALILDTNSLIK